MWDGVDYLFVDEVSMLGCEMLHKVSRALTEARGSTAAFGNVNVISAGDFAQLPPIGDARLYKDINTTSLAAASSNRSQGKILGRLLWLSFETVVILHETMRQSGRENTNFVDLLQRLRMTRYGSSHQLLSQTMRQGMSSIAGRSPIETVHDCIGTIDTHKKATITDPALIKKLEVQHSGQTKHRLRRIPLVIGMPVAINQNFDVRAGVVNGGYGILRKIRYF